MFKNSTIHTMCVGFSILLFTACESACKDTLFEFTEVSMVPRTITSSGNSIWYNDDALPISKLTINIQMVKPIQVLFNPSSECPVVYTNSNPVKEFKLVSNESFNKDYPSGTDLFELVSFSDLKQSFTKKEFVDNYVNQSNFGTFYFTFKESPEVAEMHSMKIIARFQDGASKQSAVIPVLLTPDVK